MIRRLFAFFGITLVELDQVQVPIDRWHAMHSEIDRLRHENALLREMMGKRP
jgi:hypothetical protein